MAGVQASTATDALGNWRVLLPPLEAGGPFELVAASDDGSRQVVRDVLVGNVFFCSGQSNMELQVSRALNAPSEITSSADDRIRHISVPLASAAAPQSAFTGPVSWEVASPETVADWSAVCYFFAREVRRLVDVPVGLVNASWGGSDIRAWMSAETLAAIGGYAPDLALLETYAADAPSAQRHFGAFWEAWWRERTGDAPGAEPWQPETGAAWPEAPSSLGDWKEWGVPELERHLGLLWHRATFHLSADQAALDAILSLGGIDEVDQTWLNGQVVGNTFGWGTDRTYEIPSGMLREGENVVVVNVLNTWGRGGMIGDPGLRLLTPGGADGEAVALDSWRYSAVPVSVGHPPRSPWESVGGRTTIHNAMVAPLGEVRVRGVLWYQGESNTGEPHAYRTLLRALIAQWRSQFGDPELPALIVQLASYGAPSSEPTESGWAALRDAQRLATMEDPRTALAVTIDIGDAYDVHPPNKQEVARRLVRAARDVVYGEGTPSSGPTVASVSRVGDAVELTFKHVERRLVAYGHYNPIGFELCQEATGSCRYADATLVDDRVLLRSDCVSETTRVRYCWADNPVCTLYDASGIPVGPGEWRIK